MAAKLGLLWIGAVVLLQARTSLAAFDPAAYEDYLRGLEAERAALGRRLEKARGKERVALRAQARVLVVTALTDRILPAWLGTPWGLGPKSTAIRPHQPGMVVGCSYFVTGVLQNAGLRLESRARFAQAPSAFMQQALSPAPRDLHRFPGMALAALEQRIAALGEGLYIVGLDIHTGFLLVRDGAVHVIHASYTAPTQVVDEPFTESEVIRSSRKRGYVVTPIFRDERLVEHWLRGRPVPAPAWRPR
jgi:hypothetical protein